MERMGVTALPVSRDEELLNDFAFRCFSEVADADYINARMAYRAGLYMQFHWAALQAVEKYLKGILLYNRIPANNIGHSLRDALVCCNRLPFNLILSEEVEAFIAHLDTYAGDRYLVWSYHITEPKLGILDKTIWELRRYCRVLNWVGVNSSGARVNMLQAELDRISGSTKDPPVRFKHPVGMLESLLDKHLRHPARRALVWRNEFFGARAKPPLKKGWMLHFVNSPLTLNPHILDTVLKYVYIPRKAVEEYRQYLQDQQKSLNTP